MAAVADRTVEAAAEGSDLRFFLAKRDVALDPAVVDDEALKELDEKYIIARHLDADTVLSKIQDVVGLEHKEDSIVTHEGLCYQLPSRDPEQQEYNPLLRQLCLRRGKVDSCAVGDPATSRWAKVITAVLSHVQYLLLRGERISSDMMCNWDDEVFKGDKKTVDDALLDICCLLECTRTSLNLYEIKKSMVIGPVMFTMEDGLEFPCSSLGPEGGFIQPKFSKITVAPGAEVKCILVVQGHSVFDSFNHAEGGQIRQEFGCVLVTAGDGQPCVTAQAFLRKLKDCLSVPVYALVNPDPEGLSIFCTYKFGSSEEPFDNVGLTIPDIKWIGVQLGDALALDIEDGLPLTREDVLILEGLCAKKYVMDDELLMANIHFMMYKGLKSKIEALYYHQFPPTDYIRKAINNLEGI
ncbi:unnamed protein product [Alopecurus aequalis]